MGRRIRVKAVAKKEPDVHLYVLALIALARQLEEEEVQEQQARQEPSKGHKEVER